MSCGDLQQHNSCGCGVNFESVDPVERIAQELERLNDNLEKLFYRNTASEPPNLSVMLQISPAALRDLAQMQHKK